MNQKYCIGLDVHKEQTTYAVKNNKGVTLMEGECATQYKDISNNLSKYIGKSSVVMEACTSYYHLYENMKKNNIDVHVANVIQLRKCIGKNDKIDANRLADMYRLNALPESYIPPKEIQTLRIMINIYHSIVRENVRFQNQIGAVLDMKGEFSPVNDFSSKRGMIFLSQYLMKNNDFSIRYLYDEIVSLNKKQEQIEIEIAGYIESNFAEEYELLISIPGIGKTLAAYLIAEVCPIERFENKKKLRRYAGVVPIREQSDKKIYATYLPKSSSRKLLRYALVLAANCASRFNNRLREYYLKKKNGRNHGHAIMCVTSSLSDIVYYVLKTKQPYKR
jgi:transposase